MENKTTETPKKPTAEETISGATTLLDSRITSSIVGLILAGPLGALAGYALASKYGKYKKAS